MGRYGSATRSVSIDIGKLIKTRVLTLFSGRSVNACRAAFEELKRSSGYSPLSQTTAPQTPLSAPIGPLRRPWQLETTNSYASAPPGRQLLPKTKSEGQAGVMAMSQSSTTPGGQAKRKRGRPTKAEAQAKAAESSVAAASGSLVGRESAITPRVANPGPSTAPSPALGPASAPATIASPSVEPQPQPQPKPSLPPTNRVPISAMITTPTTQKTSSHSGSSSGKRRRRKSMRSEQDDAREVHSEPIPMGPALQQRPQHQSYPYPHYESIAGSSQRRRRREDLECDITTTLCPGYRLERDYHQRPCLEAILAAIQEVIQGVILEATLGAILRVILGAILGAILEVTQDMGQVRGMEIAIRANRVDRQVDRI
jgi:hypothetical protein